MCGWVRYSVKDIVVVRQILVCHGVGMAVWCCVVGL